jgi:hypothetical protein
VDDRLHHVFRWFEGIVSIDGRIAMVGYGQRAGGQLRMSSSPHLPLVICDHLAMTKGGT